METATMKIATMRTGLIINPMRDVLEKRLVARIEQGIQKSEPYLKRIDKEGKLLNDFITPLGKQGNIAFGYGGNEVLAKVSDGKNLINNYTIHLHAIGQLAYLYDVPGAYLKDLSSGEAWQKKLAVDILQEHTLHAARKRVLVREVNGQVRGVLSDHYKRLNSAEIFGDFIRGISAQGGRIYDAYANDTKQYMETLF